MDPAKRGSAKGVSVRMFPTLKKQDGCGAMLVVAERAGEESELVTKTCELGLSLKQIGRGARGEKGGGGRTKRGGGRISARTWRALAAVGHQQRMRLMTKLLEGPATYRALQRLTKLKAGPLYHHINQLRLAGLIRPKQRDLYELTRGGRNLILAILVAGPLMNDSRRRPQARG
jgi:DNA-binding HxlR family transcriptional regulator